MANDRDLEASLERFEFAAEAAGIGVWDWNLESGRWWVGAHFAARYGLDMSVAPPEAELTRVVHPEDVDGFRKHIARALESMDRVQQRCRFVRPGGEVRYVDVQLGVTRDAGGRAVRLLGVVKDVTEDVARARELERRADAERALVERLSVATQAAGIYVWEYDWRTGVISFDETRLSRASMRRHYAAELGSDFFKWVHPDDLGIGAKAMQEALAAGESDASFRYRLRLADGTIRHVQAYARTYADNDGKPLRSLGVSWDITREVEFAEELAERHVNERELRDRLSVAIQAAGLVCWEFTYGLEKFTWFDFLPGDDAEGLEAMNRELAASSFPEDVAAIRKATAEAFERGESTMTGRLRRWMPDGSVRHFQIYQLFFRDAEGRPVRALGATRDITEEVVAQERLERQAWELQDAQQKLERASLSIQEGHWVFDLATGEHWASSTYYALLGYGPGEILLDRIDDVTARVHPDDAAASIEAAHRDIELGVPHEYELRVRMKDGSYRWFRLRGNAERDADGRPVRFAGSIQDIQKQKQAEDALREAQARFERAIAGTQDGLWEADLEQQRMWTSPRLKQLLGLTERELSDELNVLRERIHPDDLPEADLSLQWHLQNGEPLDREMRMRTKSGKYRWYRLRGTPQLDEAGRVRRVSGSMQDVTEARAARDALIQASEAAQAANRAKSAFLANVSHEIRTPMNGIIGMTSLLLDTNLDRTQRDYADTIRASADSLLTIINDILDFSKIEAGKLDIEHIEMELRSTVEDIGATMAFQAAAKGLELIVNVHPGVPERVLGDPQRIRQILINLIGNAIKFTPSGEITIGTWSVAAQERSVIHFEVRDTGIGIPPDKIKSLYEPFVQADSSTTRHYGGTGLGLSIVKRLVEMMGGRVGLESGVGKGSTFWFELPLQPVTGAAPAPEREVDHAGCRVLVVDDNETNRRVLAGYLKHARFDVSVTASAAEALDAMRSAVAERCPFDVALVDFQMPETDGAMLAERINTDTQLSSTRVVLLTSMDRLGDTARFASMGIAGFLSKPVRTRELLGCLYKVLAHAAHEWHGQTHPIVTASVARQHADARRYSGKVLLVEDNAVNQKVGMRFLERLGCEVKVAENGLEGVRAWQAEDFRLVLMDVQMPVMDGFAATRRIRELEGGRRRTPIVALTANAMTGQLDRCLEEGMDGLLTKPLEVDPLRQVLEKYCPATSGVLSDEAVADVVTAPVAPAIELSKLQDLTEGDAEFVQALAESFISSSEEILAAMREAIAVDDRQQLSRAAHQLKGASANIYASRMRDLCAHLEKQAAAMTREDIRAHVSALGEELPRVSRALEAFASEANRRAAG